MNSEQIKAVFFDFGDTLASTRPTYLQRIRISYNKLGFDVTDDQLGKAYVKTDYDIYKAYISQGAIDAREYRKMFFPTLSKHLQIDDPTGEIYQGIKHWMRKIPFTREPIEGASETLQVLKDKGIVLGIISNNDGRTPEKCEEVGIRKFFDIIADSTAVGLTKPDSRIFHHVLDELGIEPQSAVHVGDLLGADVMGGLNAGLDTIWLNSRNVGNYTDQNINQTDSPLGVLDILNLN